MQYSIATVTIIDINKTRQHDTMTMSAEMIARLRKCMHALPGMVVYTYMDSQVPRVMLLQGIMRYLLVSVSRQPRIAK